MKKKEIILISVLLIVEETFKNILEIITQNKTIDIIPNFFKLEYVKNTGAAWSIFTNQTLFLIIISFVCLIFLTFFKHTIKESKLKMYSFSLLYAGILGNLIDRILFGYVKDFFSVNFFNYDFPVFNIADIFIVSGAFLLIINIWKEEKKNEK